MSDYVVKNAKGLYLSRESTWVRSQKNAFRFANYNEAYYDCEFIAKDAKIVRLKPKPVEAMPHISLELLMKCARRAGLEEAYHKLLGLNMLEAAGEVRKLRNVG